MWGEYQEHFERLRERGRDLPKAYLARPKLEPALTWFYNSFWTLNNDRQMGQGAVGLIPFTAIEKYAERYGIHDLDAFDRFLSLIKSMDSVYAEIRNKPEKPDMLTEASSDDVEGIKGIFRRARKKPDEPPKPTGAKDGDKRDNPAPPHSGSDRRARASAARQRKPRSVNGAGSPGRGSRRSKDRPGGKQDPQ